MRVKIGLGLLATLLTLTLIGCGSGSITSTSTPGPTATLMSIAVSPSTPTVAIGTEQQFTAKGSYSDGTTQDLTKSVSWSSSSTSVATINSSGLATLLAAGKTTISASLDSVKGSTGLTVTDNLTAISVSASSNSMFVGGSLQLTAMGTYQDKKPPVALSGVTWSSSAPGIASVSSTGLVTGVAAGSATIEAQLSGVKGSLALQVNVVALESISLGPNPANVNVGSVQQLTATGHYDNGTQLNISSSVTWKVSNTALATINSLGVASGVHGGTVTVTASQGAVSQSMQMTVTALLNSISLSPVGPAILVGGNQQFTATGFYNDGTVKDLTSSASWTSSNQTAVQIAGGGKASGVAAGAANIVASLGNVSGITSLDVVTSQYANLLGDYAFTLTSLDARGPAMWAGSINFDGAGNISGIEDSNTASGVNQQVAISGTYVLYPDGRGNIIFNANACHPSGITLRFMLASSGTTGSLIQFDGVATAKGILIQQNTAAFNAAAINGTYVFRFAGLDGTGNPANGPEGIVAVGMFSADGAGNITGGVDDINDFGVVNGQNPLSASIYAVDTNGRGTFQLTDASGTTNYALYVVDSTKLYFVQTDAAPNTAVLGVAELQAPGSYNNITGTFAYLIDSPVVVQANIPQSVVKEGQLGDLVLTAPNALSGNLNNDTVNGNYINNYGGINGRGLITTCNSGQTCTDPADDQRTYFYYMVSASKMLMMQAFSYSNYQQYSPAVGEADLTTQTPYSVSSLQGNYVLQAHQGNSFADALMLLNFDGAGNLSGIVDQDQVGGVSSTLIGSPQFALTPTPLGDTVLVLTTPGGTQPYYIYLFSNSAGFLGGETTPLDGTLTQQ